MSVKFPIWKINLKLKEAKSKGGHCALIKVNYQSQAINIPQITFSGLPKIFFFELTLGAKIQKQMNYCEYRNNAQSIRLCNCIITKPSAFEHNRVENSRKFNSFEAVGH